MWFWQVDIGMQQHFAIVRKTRREPIFLRRAELAAEKMITSTNGKLQLPLPGFVFKNSKNFEG